MIDLRIESIAIKKLNDNAKTPTRGSSRSAGYDLYACVPDTIVIMPHCKELIHTGIAMAIPEGWFGGVFARSGIAVKKGLRPANCVGVIDSDYRGEILVALRNDSNDPQIVTNGERIAQLVLLPFLQAEFVEVYDLKPTSRGEGGFGSTGSHAMNEH